MGHATLYASSACKNERYISFISTGTAAHGTSVCSILECASHWRRNTTKKITDIKQSKCDLAGGSQQQTIATKGLETSGDHQSHVSFLPAMQKHMDDQAVKMDGTFCIQHQTLLLLGHPQLKPKRRQPRSGKTLS
jgi:hypothetical protein